MTIAWAHLPNAQHIDWVLADLKERPAVWGAAWDAARDATWDEAWDEAWDAARHAARSAALRAAQDTARRAAEDAAWDAAWDATWGAAWGAAWDASRHAACALVAYDGCAPLLDCPLEHLQRLYRLNPHPSFLLLQPAVIAKNTP